MSLGARTRRGADRGARPASHRALRVLDKWSGHARWWREPHAVEEQPEQESSAGWFLEFFRPHRKTLARALVLALIGAGLQMLIPVFAAIMIDHVVPHRDYTLLTLVVVAMFGAIVLTIVSNVVRVTCTIALRAPAGNNVGSRLRHANQDGQIARAVTAWANCGEAFFVEAIRDAAAESWTWTCRVPATFR